jgi:hypothetical protein
VAVLQLPERRQAPAAQPDHALLLSNAVPHLTAEQVLLALALSAAGPDDACSLCCTSVSAAACICEQQCQKPTLVVVIKLSSHSPLPEVMMKAGLHLDLQAYRFCVIVQVSTRQASTSLLRASYISLALLDGLAWPDSGRITR